MLFKWIFFIFYIRLHYEFCMHLFTTGYAIIIETLKSVLKALLMAVSNL